MRKVITTALFSMLIGLSFSQTWNQVTVPTTENLLDIEFPEESVGVGYIGGENGLLLKTTDGGTTWTEVNHSGIDIPVNFHFRDLEFANANVGYAALDGTQGIYKTINGGLNWTEMDDQSIGAFCYRSTLHVFDENHFIASGAGCFSSALIVEYNNGIWSWLITDYPTSNADHYVRDMEFRDNLGIATVNSNLFLRSTDTGQTWDTIPSPILSPNDNLTDVIIVNDTLMLAGHEADSSQSSFFQSNDAGLTWWEMQPTGGDVVSFASWMAFEESLNGDLYTSASQDGVTHFMHEKNGAIWNYEQVDRQIVSIDSYGPDVVYAVGDSGYVIVNSGDASSIEEKVLEVDVYPNPSVDVLNIELVSNIHSDLIVSDLTGKIIMTREFVSTAQLDVSDWTPGVYLITIRSDEDARKIRHIKQ